MPYVPHTISVTLFIETNCWAIYWACCHVISRLANRTNSSRS